MSLLRSVIKPIASGMLILGSTAAMHSNADEPDYSYLVSVQGSQGQQLCNGVYVGDNRVLYSQDCGYGGMIISGPTTPVPLTTVTTQGQLDLSALSDDDVIINGVKVSPADPSIVIEPSDTVLTPAQLPSDTDGLNGGSFNGDDLTINPTPSPLPPIFQHRPHQVVFTAENGIEHPPVLITKKYQHPYSGREILAEVVSVPDNITPIALASNKLIDEYESTSTELAVQIVSRTKEGNIGIDERVLKAPEHCAPPIEIPGVNYSDPLARKLCLEDNGQMCVIDLENQNLGAPVVVKTSDGKPLMLGQKITDCNSSAAVSNYLSWINLVKHKQEGLSVAAAYDLGERDVIERPQINITISNLSNEKSFDVFNPELFLAEGFSIQSSNCVTLLPGEQCTISMDADISGGLSYNDILNFNVNEQTAGTYVSVKGVSHTFIKGDSGTLWKMQGWKKSGFGFGGTIKAVGDSYDWAYVKRTRTVVDPKSVTITYKSSVYNLFDALELHIQRVGLRSSVNYAQKIRLKGTVGEWETVAFPIDEPGTYNFMILKSEMSPLTGGVFDAEISSICFGEDC